jgi:hypothetical protein
MRSPTQHRLGRHALLAGVAAVIAACGGAEDVDRIEMTGEEAAAVTTAFEVTEQPADSMAFEETIAWARANQIDTLPMGAAIAALGRTYVGTPYTAATLELEGNERLIVNLRELDCVTFIENMLAIARIMKAGTPDYDSFKRELVNIRYRDGVLSGYASRLHYFSEWIADNEKKGIVEDITLAVGGVPDTGAVNFMTRNVGAYRQLSDPAIVAEIRAIELGLTGRERHFIPQDGIDAIAQNIQDGDIIAATSTLEGLDIAHTGLALWIDGRLHLMHAPLVGSVVEISELPLADRLKNISAQDGIMVARPVDRVVPARTGP